MNELLWLGFALLDLTLVLVVFKLFGRSGLFAVIVFSLLLCNIQVMKTVELFGLTTTLGNVLYASVFFATDLLSEFFGKDAAKKGVLLGFLALAAATLYMQIALLFVPAPEDFAQPHLAVIFGFMPRVVLASMAAYLVSQWHDVWAFHFWKQKTRGRFLWLRNNLSTLVSQLLDSVIFCVIAFVGVFESGVWVQILVTTYVFKVIVAVLDTPFIYLARKVVPVREDYA
ncbi:MAG: queuosine precursor transporter [Thermodesulfobacteriota bacterium]|nr:queuosine precursor transporter [Thermodesulfobacteriota bacterium]